MTRYRIREFKDGNGVSTYKIQYSWRLLGVFTVWLYEQVLEGRGLSRRCTDIVFYCIEAAQAEVVNQQRMDAAGKRKLVATYACD